MMSLIRTSSFILYGFDKATTSLLHLAGKPPPGLRAETLATGLHYVIVPRQRRALRDLRRVSYAGQKDDLERQVGRLVEWAIGPGCQPDEAVREIGSGLNQTGCQIFLGAVDPGDLRLARWPLA